MACDRLPLRDIVVGEEQAVALDASTPLAVRILRGRGKRAFRGAGHREILAYKSNHQFLVALLGDRQRLVDVYRVELMVRPRGIVEIVISLIGAHSHIAIIVVLVAASGKNRQASGKCRNQESNCFHLLFIVVIGCKKLIRALKESGFRR